LLVLGVTVGVPYFSLSSTGPLLQKWFSDAFEGASPYRLFALSNVGSLLALLSYPFFFEVHWDSREQAVMWSWGYVVFAVCCAFCAWWTFRARQAHAAAAGKAATAARASADDARPAAWQWAAWIGLPALASVMFLAVTNEVCQNVATVPLLWIIPLSLYLISFIVAFDHPRWYVRPVCAALAIGLLVYLSNFGQLSSLLSNAVNSVLGNSGGSRIDMGSWAIHCGVFFAALLLICLICHCELAGLKPAPRYLTAYFLSMSLGGALGGIFVNLVATYAFNTFFELPLGAIASIVVAGAALALSVARFGRPATSAVALLTAAAIGCVAYWQIAGDFYQDPKARHAIIFRDRSFFGLVAVQDRTRHEPEWRNIAFRSGHILHGRQFADPAKRNTTNVAYYSEHTGIAQALKYKIKQQPNCRIGVIGLGAGTIAGYAQPGNYLRLYEINQQVVDIANDYFYFLKDCKAPYDLVLGDARLQLERELEETGGQGHQFDVLCLDAFSGDAVPTHLITTEAFALYKQHVKPDGIIVCNITNTYLDLYPVVKRLAEEHNFGHTRIYRPADPDTLIYRSYYFMLTNDQEFLRQTPETLIDMPANFQQERVVPLWTDRYHNLFQILR
jgi:spermidine synthase